MKIRNWGLALAGVGTIAIGGCASVSDSTTDGLSERPPVAEMGPTVRSAQAAPRWRKRGPAKVSNLPSPNFDNKPLPANEPTAEEMAHWTDAQWMEHIRPVTFFNGDEYELDESDESYMARWRAGRNVVGQPSRGSMPETPPELDLAGGLGPRVVIPPNDDRRLITNPWDFPHRAVGVLNNYNVAGATPNQGCTMTLIGPSTAISAAHCFYNSGSGWQPGKAWGFGWQRTSAGVDSSQYGSGVGSGCYWVTIPSGYTTTDSVADDYAVIEFSNSQGTTCNLFPGNTVGWLGYFAASDSQISSYPINVEGYAGDGSAPSYLPSTIFGYTSYRWPTIAYHGLAAGGAWGSSNVVYTNADTSGGQSGAGYMTTIGGTPYVTAIHRGNPGGGSANYGRRLDSTVLGFISANSAL